MTCARVLWLSRVAVVILSTWVCLFSFKTTWTLQHCVNRTERILRGGVTSSRVTFVFVRRASLGVYGGGWHHKSPHCVLQVKGRRGEGAGGAPAADTQGDGGRVPTIDTWLTPLTTVQRRPWQQTFHVNNVPLLPPSSGEKLVVDWGGRLHVFDGLITAST